MCRFCVVLCRVVSFESNQLDSLVGMSELVKQVPQQISEAEHQNIFGEHGQNFDI